MKIEKPKSDNYLLSVAAQPETQRVVIESIAQCHSAEELERILAPLTFWAWDRGDVLCWAPVLNLFDDFLASYIVKHRLGGPVCYQSCNEVLRNNTTIEGDVSDILVERMLHVTFLILGSCSSRIVYNSSEHLIALLDSFNPTIVFSALQSLTLFHSCFRNKTRRQIDPRYSSELLLRLPFLCANPIRDLAGTSLEASETESSCNFNVRVNEDNETQQSNCNRRSQSARRGARGHRVSEYSSSSSSMADVPEVVDDGTPTPNPFSSTNDELGEIVSVYLGRVRLDPRNLKTRHVRLQQRVSTMKYDKPVVESKNCQMPPLPRSKRKTEEVPPEESICTIELSYADLLGGFTIEQIESMDLSTIVKHQTQLFYSFVSQHLGETVLTDVPTISSYSPSSTPLDGQLQELRQKIRTLWYGCHPLGRQLLVETRIAALFAILCLNSQFFLNCLMTSSTLLPDLALVLTHHEKLDKRTLCCVLDLWTGILQEKVQHRSTIHLLGLNSPHGLFPSLFRKFLSSPIECDHPIPSVLTYATTDEQESAVLPSNDHGSEPIIMTSQQEPPTVEILPNSETGNGGQSSLNHIGTPMTPSPPLSSSNSVVTSNGSTSGNATQVTVGRLNFDMEIHRPVEPQGHWMRHQLTPEGILPPVKCKLYEESDNKHGVDCARLRCRVLENLMEMYLAVVSTTASFSALSHPAILQRLVDFLQVLDPDYLTAVIGVGRIFDSLMDFSITAFGTLYGPLNAATRLAQRLQYEVATLNHLPILEGETARTMAFYADNPSQLSGGVAHQSCTSDALRDLTSPEATTTLRLLEEVAHRRCLVRVILRELGSCLHPPEMNANNLTQLIDIYSGPCGLASRVIFRNPHHFGLSLYNAATTVLSEFISEDPASQPGLIKRQVVTDFLESITPGVLQIEETLQSVPVCIAAVLLHNSGEAAMRKLNYAPIYITASAVTREDFVGLDRAGEISALMGSRLDEAARNQRNAAEKVLDATKQMVKSMAEEAWRLPKWEPVPHDVATELVGQYLASPPATLEDLKMPLPPKDRYLPDRLANMARFLQTLLSSSKTMWAFIKDGGPEYILKAVTAPALPPLFLRVLPHHPMNSVIRVLATSTEPNQPTFSPPSFVFKAVENLPKAVAGLSAIESLSFNTVMESPTLSSTRTNMDVDSVCNLVEQSQPESSSSGSNEGVSPENGESLPSSQSLLQSLIDIDMAVHLLLVSNKESVTLSWSSQGSNFRSDQSVPFLKLLSRSLGHIYTAFPLLLHFLYRNSAIHPTETPVVLSTRHSPHEHPGVRASKKYLPPEVQVVQPTNFFWTSLTKYSYSVPNPHFEVKSFPSQTKPGDLLSSPTFVFEIVRATGVQCRILLATASRLINSVPARRSRMYQAAARVSPEQHVTATSLALAVKRFLERIPEIPLPRTLTGDSTSVSNKSKEQLMEIDKHTIGDTDMKNLLSASGLNIIQTARYIAEVMDIFYRLHVDDKNHGSLLTLTVDTFYKLGGLNLIVRGHHYAFGLLLAVSVRIVKDTSSHNQKDIIDGVAKLIGATNSLFTVWLEAVVNEVNKISEAQMKSACDIVSKCLHCCISYCEKITSWKRLYNSPMSAYLQKACGLPVDYARAPTPPLTQPQRSRNGEESDTPIERLVELQGGPEQTSSLSDQRIAFVGEPQDIIEQTRVLPEQNSVISTQVLTVDVDSLAQAQGSHSISSSTSNTCDEMTSTPPLQEPFAGSLPLCGSGIGEEFDAATLLRSLQGEVSRHALIWIEGLTTSSFNFGQCSDLSYRVNETLFGHFPSKAINCLVKIFFHFLDAESPQRRQHASSWKSQHSPSTAEYTERMQQQQQPRSGGDLDVRETITRLVELQYSQFAPSSSTSPSAAAREPPLELDWIFGSLSETGGGQCGVPPSSEDQTSNAIIATEERRGVDVEVQTEGLSQISVWSKLSAERSGTVRDWTIEDSQKLRQLIQPKIFDLMLDLGKRMPSYCLVIGESLMKLVNLPLPLGGTSTVEEVSMLTEQQIAESNAVFAAQRLVERLNTVYSSFMMISSEQRTAILLASPPVTLLTAEGPANSSKGSSTVAAVAAAVASDLASGSLSSSEQGHRVLHSPRLSSLLQSANDTPRELKATDDNQDSELEAIAKTLHEAFHTHFYFLINLLHRSPTVSKTILERDESPFQFFHKFLVLFTNAKKEASSSLFPSFFSSAEGLGVTFAREDEIPINHGHNNNVLSSSCSPWDGSIPIPSWCLQPCKPYLLKNNTAIQTAQSIVNAGLRKSPSSFDPDAPTPLSILDKPATLPKGTRPPEWFSCCFLGMVELLRFFELEHQIDDIDTSFIGMEFTHNRHCRRLIPVQLQRDLITTALDVFHYFPGLDGTLATTSCQLLLPLTSLISNAQHMLNYSPIHDPTSGAITTETLKSSYFGGGLGVLLRLSRTAHFSGMLRLLSAIVSNLCETKAGLETKLEADLQRYFGNAAEIRKFRIMEEHTKGKVIQEKPEDAPSARCEPVPVTIDNTDVEMKDSSPQQEASDMPLNSDFVERRVVPLNKLVESLYPYVRRDPETFKRVISRMCLLYIEMPSTPAAPIVDDAAGGIPVQTGESSVEDQLAIGTEKVSSKESLKNAKLWMSVTSSEKDYSTDSEHQRRQDVNASAERVLPILINYLDLFTSIHAHTRLTPSFSEVFLSSTDHPKPFSGEAIKDVPMYPFAILPDSILFLLDDLLSSNSHYASTLLDDTLGASIEASSQSGLVWPSSSTTSTVTINEKGPWLLTSCCSYKGSLLSYLMRCVFPKALLLASPNCCATIEWKEGHRPSPSTSTSDTGELEALTGVAVMGELKPTFDTLMHLATKLIRTACNGSTKIQQAMFFELLRILLEMECRGPPITASSCVALYQSVDVSEPSSLRDYFSSLPSLPRSLFVLGVYTAASALSSAVFHLPLNVNRLSASRRALAQMTALRSSTNATTEESQPSKSPLTATSGCPTADDILALRLCVCRLLGSIDLCAMDSQPVCRSLIRCLEFLVRDPIILLLSMGVPEPQLMEGLMKLVGRQRIVDATPSAKPPLVTAVEQLASVEAPSGTRRVLEDLNRVGYRPDCHDHEAAANLMPAVLATVHDPLGTGFGLSLSAGISGEGRPSTGEDHEDDHVMDDEDDEDDEDESSSNPDDIMMDDGEEAVSVSLPHEADEHEETDGHFGVRRRSESDLESDEDAFDDEEDAPRIRTDDHETDTMLGMLNPDEIQEHVNTLICNGEDSRGNRLLEDEENGTPGLLSDGLRRRRRDEEDDQDNESDTAMTEEVTGSIVSENENENDDNEEDAYNTDEGDDVSGTRVRIVDGELEELEGEDASFVEGLLGQELLALDGFPPEDANFLGEEPLPESEQMVDDDVEEDEAEEDDEGDEEDEEDEEDEMEIPFGSARSGMIEAEIQMVDMFGGQSSSTGMPASMTSFYLSIPSGGESRHNNVPVFSGLSNPPDPNGVSRVDAQGSWTVPGDLGLPSFNPILSFSRSRTGQTAQSGATSSAQLSSGPRISTTLISPQSTTTISLRGPLFDHHRQEVQSGQRSRPTQIGDREPLQLASALSPNQLLFDPWSSMVLSRSDGGGRPATVAAAEGLFGGRSISRPPPPTPGIELYEREGVNTIINDFREWATATSEMQQHICVQLTSQSTSPSSRGVTRGVPTTDEFRQGIQTSGTPNVEPSGVLADEREQPSQEPQSIMEASALAEQRTEVPGTPLLSTAQPSLEIREQDPILTTIADEDVRMTSVADDTVFAAIGSTFTTSEVATATVGEHVGVEELPEVPLDLPMIEQSVEAEHGGLDDQRDETVAHPAQAAGGISAETRDAESEGYIERFEETATNTRAGTLEDYYYIIRHEELVEPLPFQSVPIRNLALCLGLTQRQFLTSLGIDAEFLAALPPDMQHEVLGQTARNLSVSEITVMRSLNLQSIDTYKEIVDRSPAIPSTADSIRFLPDVETSASATVNDATVDGATRDSCSTIEPIHSTNLQTPGGSPSPNELQSTNPESCPRPPSLSTNCALHVIDSSVAASNESNLPSVSCGLVGPSGQNDDFGVSVPLAPQDNNSESPAVSTSVADELPLIPTTSNPGRSNRHIDPSSCRVPGDVLRLFSTDVRHLVNEALNGGNRNSGTQSPVPGASRSNDLDNATFLATLDPQLRQELLLTATEEDLRALPPEYVAEAALLRDRARHRHDVAHPNHPTTGGPQRHSRRPQLAVRTSGGELPRLDRPSGSGGWTRVPNLPRDVSNLYNAIFSVLQPTTARPAASGTARSSNLGGIITPDMIDEAVAMGGTFRSSTSTSGGPTSTGAGISSISVGGDNNPIEMLMEQILQDFGMALEQQGEIRTHNLGGRYHRDIVRTLRTAPMNSSSGISMALPSYMIPSLSRQSHQSGETRFARMISGIPSDVASFLHSAIPPITSFSTSSTQQRGTAFRTTLDVASIPIRPPSMIDIPVDPLSVLAACRLLYLKRQIYRRDVHRLFLSLAASHPVARRQLLQFLMVVIWSCATDVQHSLRLPSASSSLERLGFPPKRLYSAMDLPASLLFDSDAEATSSIAAYRALEHTRSLLEVVPQVAEFFGTLVIHPAFVEIQNGQAHYQDKTTPRSPNFSGLSPLEAAQVDKGQASSSSSLRAPGEVESAMLDVESGRRVTEDSDATLQELRRKKKKRDSDQPSWCSVTPTASSSSCTTGTGITEYTTSSGLKIEGKTANSVQRSNRNRTRHRRMVNGRDVREDYPVNVLLMLIGSSRFQTSATHMLHLLAAIHYLLCGASTTTGGGTRLHSGTTTNEPTAQGLSSSPLVPQQPTALTERSADQSSSLRPISDRNPPEERQEGRSANDNSNSAANGSDRLDENNPVQPEFRESVDGQGIQTVGETVQLSPAANVPTNLITTSGSIERTSEDPPSETAVVANVVVPQPSLSIKGTTGTTSRSAESSSASSIHDRIVNVVSDEGAASICRIFSGLSPGDASPICSWSSQMLWGIGGNNQQSQWPLLSKIVARLFWSPKHHASVRETLLNSTNVLSAYVMDCLVQLRQHISKSAPSLRQIDSFKSQQSLIQPVADVLLLDFLPPEHLREKFDVALNLLLRLSSSLQDVFWGELVTNSQQASSTTIDQTPSLINLPVQSGQPQLVNEDPQPTAVPTAAPNTVIESTVPLDASQREKQQPVETAVHPSPSASEIKQAERDRKALNDFRDFFDAVGVKSLWRVLDATLRDIELACPSLKLPAATASESPFPVEQEAVDISESGRRRGSDELAVLSSHRRTRDVLRTTELPVPAVNEVSSSNNTLSPPLLVNQLLPLIDCYLLIQQVSIAAELGLKASEVPRVQSSSSNRGDAQLQQSFAETVSTILLNPEARLSGRHADMLIFCERHRRLLNLLIQQTPGMLSGAFQPLVALAPMCITFENKRLYFRQKLKQLREGTRHEPIRLNVRRNLVFMDSFHQLRIRNSEEMKGKLIVHFQGEEGIDAGGLTREWYAILAKEMFNPDYALFRREGSKAEFNHPNPLSSVNPDHLSFFKFIGRVIGKAIYDGQHIGAYFTRSFYKHMLGRPVSPADAESIDPEFYKSLQMLLTHRIEDLGLDLRFSTEIDHFGRTQIVDLIPDGRNMAVTEDNKHDYVKLVCEHKISHGVRAQIESFLEGFHELVPPKFLTIFDDKELELLISGLSFVDLNDLRANTSYQGYDSNSPQVMWFWEVLEEMDQNRLATFLQFVTGTSRVPLGGFRELMGMRGPQQFSIHRDYGEHRLPSAHTCFNQLDLPEYSSRELLKTKLLQAISEGKEGFGFV